MDAEYVKYCGGMSGRDPAQTSEDIYRGIQVKQRGGTSLHIKGVSAGKAREATILGMFGFALKIAAGKAFDNVCRSTTWAMEHIDLFQLNLMLDTGRGQLDSIVCSFVAAFACFLRLVVTQAIYGSDLFSKENRALVFMSTTAMVLLPEIIPCVILIYERYHDLRRNWLHSLKQAVKENVVCAPLFVNRMVSLLNG